ncbi:uncharacterized protein C8Q71DRAFT_727897 [Rhodofomes roseus]|uniref:Uncharacterized protein n=1 Tax=Rhodofomes roseus TaxID=34475 RepID=A0ABQ8K0F2_9APHY|nr:uncharacterized protein C8Q71DRAFT_727897 [Rhodofomes roseus]KAH9829927.1 hypothetical protein C8Q71DRAFT_727897 [Rhodofomes roseus]
MGEEQWARKGAAADEIEWTCEQARERMGVPRASRAGGRRSTSTACTVHPHTRRPLHLGHLPRIGLHIGRDYVRNRYGGRRCAQREATVLLSSGDAHCLRTVGMSCCALGLSMRWRSDGRCDVRQHQDEAEGWVALGGGDEGRPSTSQELSAQASSFKPTDPLALVPSRRGMVQERVRCADPPRFVACHARPPQRLPARHATLPYHAAVSTHRVCPPIACIRRALTAVSRCPQHAPSPSALHMDRPERNRCSSTADPARPTPSRRDTRPFLSVSVATTSLSCSPSLLSAAQLPTTRSSSCAIHAPRFCRKLPISRAYHQPTGSVLFYSIIFNPGNTILFLDRFEHAREDWTEQERLKEWADYRVYDHDHLFRYQYQHYYGINQNTAAMGGRYARNSFFLMGAIAHKLASRDVLLFGTRHNVQVYNARNAMKPCTKCWRWGHGSDRCTQQKLCCPLCGEHHTEEAHAAEASCCTEARFWTDDLPVCPSSDVSLSASTFIH